MKDIQEARLRRVMRYKNRIWYELVDTFDNYQFRTNEAIQIIMKICRVEKLTARDYWRALSTYWLTDDNSDLIKFRQGLYGWTR